MKKLILLLIPILVSCQMVTTKDFEQAKKSINEVKTSLTAIQSNNKEINNKLLLMNQNVDNVIKSIDATTENIIGIQKDLNDVHKNIDQSKNNLHQNNANTEVHVKAIQNQTKVIDKAVDGTKQQEQVNQSTAKINRQAQLLLRINAQNKKIEDILEKTNALVKQANDRADLVQIELVKQKEQAIKAKTQAQNALALSKKNQQYAKNAKDKSEQTQKSIIKAQSTFSKTKQALQKSLQANHQTILYILYGVLTLGILVAAGGAASIFTGFMPPKVGIAAIITGVILFSVSMCIIEYYQAFKIIGLILIILSFIGLGVYVAWHFFISNRANGELVQLIDHTKQHLSDEAKDIVFKAKTNIADAYQSQTTKSVVKSIKKKIDNNKIKQQIRKIKNKIKEKI